MNNIRIFASLIIALALLSGCSKEGNQDTTTPAVNSSNASMQYTSDAAMSSAAGAGTMTGGTTDTMSDTGDTMDESAASESAMSDASSSADTEMDM